MELHDQLFEIERELGAGDGDAYRRHLTDGAVVIVPGQAMGKEDTEAAIDASPRWDEFTFDDERLTQLTDDAALLTYRFSGRRGDDRYEALMGSVYVNHDGAWKMSFHQQTPSCPAHGRCERG